MQFIAVMLKNFLVVTLKLCSMLGLQHHAQNYAGVIYLGPLPTTVHQRATLTWKIREHNQIYYSWIQTNTVKLLITIDNSLQFLERLSCMCSSLSELWSTTEIRLKHMINQHKSL